MGYIGGADGLSRGRYAAGGVLVLRGPTVQYNKEWIKHRIIRHRDACNRNNPTRTNFYLRYWDRHREVPWALLAHIVSRNAGYQMSDLVRLHWFLNKRITLGLYPMEGMVKKFIDPLFAFLEAGNFLIFRDVFPQLATYAWVKRLYIQTGRDYSTELFEMLTEDDFGVDPFIVKEWKQFFDEARNASWWADDPDPAARDPVARHTLALVVNEQNYIEERLVNPNPGAIKYLGRFSQATTRKTMWLVNNTGLTKLILAEGEPQDTAQPHRFMVYAIGDFGILDERIKVGRDLYVCIFRSGRVRSDLVQAWVTAKQNKKHHGTRTDYDRLSYSADLSAALLHGKRYSPPLVRFQGQMPAWPINPGEDKRFRHIHGKPSRLRPWSKKFSKRKIDGWLDYAIRCDAEISVFGPNRKLIEILI